MYATHICANRVFTWARGTIQPLVVRVFILFVFVWPVVSYIAIGGNLIFTPQGPNKEGETNTLYTYTTVCLCMSKLSVHAPFFLAFCY